MDGGEERAVRTVKICCETHRVVDFMGGRSFAK